MKNKIWGQTQRLFFRKISIDDFNLIAKMLNQKSVKKIWGKEFKNNDIKKWIENCMCSYSNSGEGFYIIEHKQKGYFIGQISLSKDTINGKDYYEIGYILNEKYMNQGYATEAAKHMVEFAFEIIKTNKVIFEIRPDNTKSINVAKRLGAKETGRFIKKIEGNLVPHIIYSIENPAKHCR